MWLLNFHISVSILCLLTILGFIKIFEENIINNGWIEKKELKVKKNFIYKIKVIFMLFVPILNLLITFVVIFTCFINKSEIERINNERR